MPQLRTSIYFTSAFAAAQIGAMVLGCSPGRAADADQATPSAKTGTMSQPVGTPEKPKTYQPANPAPDTRSAPTSSSTGVGFDNGEPPKDQKK